MCKCTIYLKKMSKNSIYLFRGRWQPRILGIDIKKMYNEFLPIQLDCIRKFLSNLLFEKEPVY